MKLKCFKTNYIEAFRGNFFPNSTITKEVTNFFELFLEDSNYIFRDLDNLTLKEIQAKYWIAISNLTSIFCSDSQGKEAQKSYFVIQNNTPGLQS